MPRPGSLRQFVAAVALLLGTTLAVGGTSAAVAQNAGGQVRLPGAVAPQGGIIDQILVRVNGAPILYSDFEAQWAEMLTNIATQLPQDQIDAQLAVLRMSVMVAMVEELMIEQRAEELGFAAGANDIDRAVMAMREQYGLLEDGAWQQALTENGLSEAGLRESFARNIVQSRMINAEIQRQVVVSNREVASYYEDNIDEFTEPAQVLYQQLLWLVPANTDAAPVRAQAEAALAELRSGVSLSAVGDKYEAFHVQDAASASWMSPNDLRPEILDTINTLTPLSYSDVVETPGGLLIMQLMDRKETQVQPPEAVAQQIRVLLQDRKSQEKFQEYSNSLFVEASIDILAPEFDELTTAWAATKQGAAVGPSR